MDSGATAVLRVSKGGWRGSEAAEPHRAEAARTKRVSGLVGRDGRVAFLLHEDIEAALVDHVKVVAELALHDSVVQVRCPTEVKGGKYRARCGTVSQRGRCGTASHLVDDCVARLGRNLYEAVDDDLLLGFGEAATHETHSESAQNPFAEALMCRLH